MSKRKVPAALQALVRNDAKNRCGYCLTQRQLIGQPMTMEHLVPVAKGGETSRENLWLACRRCNEFRGTQTHGVDPLTASEAPLFNPRLQTWSAHFIWSDDSSEIVGLTSVGRATVVALRLNNEDIKMARRLWVMTGLHSPQP